MKIGITLTELEDYSPRLLQVAVEAYEENRREQYGMLAWVQANIMNRWMFKKMRPVTIPGLMGESSPSVDSAADFKAMMETDQHTRDDERERKQQRRSLI